MTTLDRFNLTLLECCPPFPFVTTYEQNSSKELEKLVLLTASEHSLAVPHASTATWKQ